jgi:mannose-6-phosphate isomerase-like protein (cupin superfamily)
MTTETMSVVERYSRIGGQKRWPRVITMDDITSLPRFNFARGLYSQVFISREKDEARYFIQGLQFHAPDHEDFEWEQDAWDEGYRTVKGVMRCVARDATGREVALEAKEGEHMYLPAGYFYRLENTGVETIAFWTVAPNLKRGLAPLVELNLPEAPEYSKTLKGLRDSVPDSSPGL